MNAVWCFIQTSRGNVVLLVVCVLLLIGVVTWPEIKRWSFKAVGHVPKPKPDPPEVRLDKINESLATLATWDALREGLEKQNRINEGVAGIYGNHGERIGTLEDDRTKAIAERGALDRKTNAIVTILGARLPQQMLRQGELTELLLENRSCCQEYMDLRAIYPDHLASSKPFARGWRPSRPEQEIDEVTRHYEQWARHMEYHMNRLQSFSEKWDIYQTKPEIFGWVKHWFVNSHDKDGQVVVSAIADVMRDLANLRERYAADLERAAGQLSTTIS